MDLFKRGVLLLISTLMGVGILWPGASAAAGPWTAQVVDAETGKPLEGVVALAYWIKYTGMWHAGGDPKFYDAEEVVTGPDGRFIIQARSTWTLLWWREIRGYFVIFKPGYGQWRYRGYEEWQKLRIWERQAQEEEARKWEETGEIESGEVVIELPPLRTRGERLRFLDSVGLDPLPPVPLDRTEHLQKAKDEERAYLGLPKIYERKR